MFIPQYWHHSRMNLYAQAWKILLRYIFSECKRPGKWARKQKMTRTGRMQGTYCYSENDTERPTSLEERTRSRNTASYRPCDKKARTMHRTTLQGRLLQTQTNARKEGNNNNHDNTRFVLTDLSPPQPQSAWKTRPESAQIQVQLVRVGGLVQRHRKTEVLQVVDPRRFQQQLVVRLSFRGLDSGEHGGGCTLGPRTLGRKFRVRANDGSRTGASHVGE